MSKRSDSVPLGDMYDAAREISQLLGETTKDAFLSNRTLQLSVVHLIQTIGEAARQVSGETQNIHPEIDWTGIKGMRHRIVHDYRRVNFDRVWDVATQDVPALIDLLSKFVPPDPP